jgi:nitroreductase
MDVSDAIRSRRMARAFDPHPVPPDVVDGLIDLARRAPSAGNTQPWAFVVLEGDATALLWDVTLPPSRRVGFRWQRLLDAPVLVVPLVSPAAYPARYAEPDKARTGLGASEDAWPVPYWWVDGGMAVHGLLLAAEEIGLGALFFGLFEHEAAVLAALDVPGGWRALGAVAVGWRVPGGEAPGRSAGRVRPPVAAVVHRGGWRGVGRGAGERT